MKIKSLHLYTNKLEKEKEFYAKTLGFDVVMDNKEMFGVHVGWSELFFHRSIKAHVYHYCFLIPCNQLEEALLWMKEKTDLIDIEGGRLTQRFESWNADSFYFHDASGNLAECIVRHDLKNESRSSFDLTGFLCVNEIGMPTTNIKDVDKQLGASLQTSFWKGDYDRFGTHGSQEGLFLLPNHKVKKEWFPSNQKIASTPFDITVEHNATLVRMRYENERIRLL